MADDKITREMRYHTTVEMVYRARCVSPTSGEDIVVIGDSISDARRRVDLKILEEAEQRGLSVARIEVLS